MTLVNFSRMCFGVRCREFPMLFMFFRVCHDEYMEFYMDLFRVLVHQVPGLCVRVALKSTEQFRRSEAICYWHTWISDLGSAFALPKPPKEYSNCFLDPYPLSLGLNPQIPNASAPNPKPLSPKTLRPKPHILDEEAGRA